MSDQRGGDRSPQGVAQTAGPIREPRIAYIKGGSGLSNKKASRRGRTRLLPPADWKKVCRDWEIP